MEGPVPDPATWTTLTPRFISVPGVFLQNQSLSGVYISTLIVHPFGRTVSPGSWTPTSSSLSPSLSEREDEGRGRRSDGGSGKPTVSKSSLVFPLLGIPTPRDDN